MTEEGTKTEQADNIGQTIVARLKLAQGQAKQTGQRNQETGNDLRKKLFDRGVYERYINCTLDRCAKIPGLEQREQQKIDKYISHIAENIKQGTGLMLVGKVGTGKTSLAAAILQEWIKTGHSGLFITMSSLLDTLFTLKAQNREKWAEYEQRIRDVSLLVLDDLGSEHHEGWVLTKVDSIIAERYNRCKATIVTTNMNQNELRNTYAERIFDRLKSTSVMVTFDGDSMRKPVKGV